MQNPQMLDTARHHQHHVGRKVCAVASAHRLLLVAAALVLVGFGAAGAVCAEPVSAKEKPLYVGDFGPRYERVYDEFRMLEDARAKWRSEQVQKRTAVPSPSPLMDCGVSSYRSSEQLKNAKPFFLN
ncbi:MAG: hypothetical protein Q8T09_19730 [Candidatus Melainabacteria bacterium]|nr:hypothetical protein [Candidatus Melainabacteria bacterium]